MVGLFQYYVHVTNTLENIGWRRASQFLYECASWFPCRAKTVTSWGVPLVRCSTWLEAEARSTWPELFGRRDSISSLSTTAHGLESPTSQSFWRPLVLLSPSRLATDALPFTRSLCNCDHSLSTYISLGLMLSLAAVRFTVFTWLDKLIFY